METQTKEIINEVDAALKTDSIEYKQENKEALNFKKATSLGAFMRVIGSVILIAAAIASLVQRWSEMSHILRYFSFLGFTGTLTLCGFFSATYLREAKGARTFLALAATMVTVNFAQLGGLLYSPFISNYINIPEVFRWTETDPLHYLPTTAIALCLLTPITILSMRVLARSRYKMLSIIYLALNGLLLIPSRESSFIGIFFFIGIATAIAVDEIYAKETAAKTTEGLIVRTLLFIPPILLIGRNILLYEATQSLFGLASLTFGYIFFTIAPKNIANYYHTLCHAIAYLFGIIGWYLVSDAIHSQLALPAGLSIPLFVLPVAISLFLISVIVKPNSHLEQGLASLLMITSAIIEAIVYSGIESSLYCIIVGLLAAILGYSTKKYSAYASGLMCLALGLFVQVKHSITFYSISPWITLAILGIIIVLAASYIEKYYSSIASRFKKLTKKEALRIQ
jgi:hypothetical protein